MSGACELLQKTEPGENLVAFDYLNRTSLTDVACNGTSRHQLELGYIY